VKTAIAAMNAQEQIAAAVAHAAANLIGDSFELSPSFFNILQTKSLTTNNLILPK